VAADALGRTPLPADPSARSLRIIHFNDVYNITEEKVEPVGGAARFATALKRELHPPLPTSAAAAADPSAPSTSSASDHPAILVFSGDTFFPSMMSSILKGRQMVPVLNGLGVAVACLGNHELDGGVETLRSLMADCTFPFLCGNVLDARTRRPFCGTRETHVIEHGSGLRVGFLGVVEQDWIVTLGTVEPEVSVHTYDYCKLYIHTCAH
jgi:5'-nucleotidase